MTCDRQIVHMTTGTNLSRRSRGIRRRWLPALLLCVVVQMMFPVHAYAWFGWLDDLSGPGPFWGGEFEFRFACLMDQPPLSEAITHMQTARTLVPITGDKANNTTRDIANKLEGINDKILGMALDATLKEKGKLHEVLDEMNAQRMAINLATPVPLSQPPKSPAGQSAADESLAGIEIARAEDLLRESQVPHVSRPHGAILWNNCHDHPSKNAEKETGIRRQDRHPVLSFGLDYREYANSKYWDWGTPRDQYSLTHLSVIEPTVSWPLSGRYDVLDGQTGLGLYIFRTGPFSGSLARGLIVEPIRFDVHFPARLLDNHPCWGTRLFLSLSLRSGVVLFPAGFDENTFATADQKAAAAKNGTVATPRIPGGEAIWENGISVDVGRLFFGR
jgi:hypothetical protein